MNDEAAQELLDTKKSKSNYGYMKWLFFSYTLPSKPSQPRVHVWRQLNKLGAINYLSLWILPYSNGCLSDLQKLVSDIQRWKGEAMFIEGKVSSKENELRITRAFTEARDEEYLEIINKCDDYAKEIENEIARHNFIFAEVEENEEELAKLKLWLKKIQKRDIFEAPLCKAAINKVKSCQTLFDQFAELVYRHSHSVKNAGKTLRTKGS